MSEPDLGELPEDVRALLDEEAQRTDPSADRVERMRENAARVLVERHDGPAVRRAAGAARGPLWFTSGVLVGALVVGWLWRRSPPRTVVVNQVVVVHIDASVATRVIERDGGVGADARTGEFDAGTSVESSSAGPSNWRPRALLDASTAERDWSLRSERELIETAQSALARRQWRDAIRACEVHLQRFARAQWVEEREVIWIQALAGEGRATDAWARAESFRRRFPTSMLRAVVDRAAPATSGRDAG
jgi:hypothetical protein